MTTLQPYITKVVFTSKTTKQLINNRLVGKAEMQIELWNLRNGYILKGNIMLMLSNLTTVLTFCGVMWMGLSSYKTWIFDGLTGPYILK